MGRTRRCNLIPVLRISLDHRCTSAWITAANSDGEFATGSEPSAASRALKSADCR